MDRASEQEPGAGERPRSAETRQRLLAAAAQLIAEYGWGGVRTRAVAERACLPHGTVSYHFTSKQELLTEAAMQTVERKFPVAELEALDTVEDLRPLFTAWTTDGETIDPVGRGVLMEAMRESERNPELRRRLAALMDDYRRGVAGLVRDEQHSESAPVGTSAEALATLIAAAGDGLLLHALLDSELDTTSAFEALLALLRK